MKRTIDDIAESIVQSDVYLCLSCLVQELINNQVPEYEEFYNAPFETDEETEEVEYREVFEYWAVSSYLAERLQKHDEIVTEYCNLYIWHRTTTGQSISMDYVIQEIAKSCQ